MRLIDADALFLPDEKSDKVYIIGGRSGKMVALAMELLKKKVADAPTIEAETVRHGYWENANGRPKTYIRKCSVCGKEAYFCGRGCSYKFCPNCGAKMEG